MASERGFENDRVTFTLPGPRIMKYLVAFCLLVVRLAIAGDMPAFQPGNRILFQGDSITHGGRGGDPNHFMGHGYHEPQLHFVRVAVSRHAENGGMEPRSN